MAILKWANCILLLQYSNEGLNQCDGHQDDSKDSMRVGWQPASTSKPDQDECRDGEKDTSQLRQWKGRKVSAIWLGAHNFQWLLFLFIPIWLVEKWTRYLSACYLHALTMYKLYLCVVYWVHIYLVHCHRGLIPGNQHQKWLVWWRLRETTYRCEEIFQWHNDYPCDRIWEKGALRANPEFWF